MLAPCSMGFKSAGVATVLSTIKGILCFLATSEIAFKSSTSNFGLPSDSAKTKRVFSCIAASKLDTSFGSTKVVVIPKRGSMDFSILYDPPYKLFEDTM